MPTIETPAASPDTIFIGAHYDKADRGCGAVDNWTGIVLVAHMYKTLARAPLRKSLMFVAFGNEERGLVGSRAMLDRISDADRKRSCAMVNLDSFDRSAPQVLDNASNPKLAAMVGELAVRMNVPFSHAGLRLSDSDSTSFNRVGIPAVTLHGMSHDFRSVLHTDRDQASIVDPDSLNLGYRLALGVVAEIDNAPCDAFR
jgi:Zn-dependent M28 family amino/carboxypeptidase